MTTRELDLAFNPGQPRDRQGRWSRIAGAIGRSLEAGEAVPPPYVGGLGRDTSTKFAPERSTWQAMAEFGPREKAAQEASGIWGPGRSYAQHTADLARLSPAGRKLYDQHVIAGKGPYEALRLAQAATRPPPSRLRRDITNIENFLTRPPKARKPGSPPPLFGSAVPQFASEAAMTTLELVATPVHERAAGRKALAAKGQALPGGGFPIPNVSYLHKAMKAIGRVKDNKRRAAVARLIKKRASQLGVSHHLKGTWVEKSPGKPLNASNVMVLAREPYHKEADETIKCPFCGKWDSPDAIYCDQCGRKLPDSAFEHSNTGGKVIEMARRMPVMDPADIVVARGADGTAIIRHRRGGQLIGTIHHDPDRGWLAEPDGGQEGPGHTHQRGALVELLGLHNRAAGTAQASPQPLQPPPVQTPLMERFGVPAIRLATPSNGASDGPRTAQSDGGNGGASLAGLNPRGVTIYRKLRQKMPADRALAFARRAQSFGGKKAS